MTEIDRTALVSADATLAEGVEIGPYTVVEADVAIGPNTKIGPHCMIQGPTTIGSGCTITGYASIGAPPQDHTYTGEKTSLAIGDNNTIREFVTINRGTLKERGVTEIGSHNLIMAYCHVAHDCVLGNHIVMGNLATLAGHVRIHDHAIIGGLSAIHQFVHIGSYSIIGGGSMVTLDIIPYVKASGDRAKLYGINSIGLKRNGFDSDQIKNISNAYKTLFKKGLLLKEALKALEGLSGDMKEIHSLIDFISSSQRGIAR